jgi:hypothetical protein
MNGYYHAAIAASFLYYHDVTSAAVRPGTPVPPVALPPANMLISPSRLSQAAPTGHKQNKPVCDSYSLIISLIYSVWAQWHRQKSTYRTRMRARACENLHHLLIYKFNYLKNCLCHCALSVLTRLSVCSTRMFLSVPSVPKGFCNEY